jgi:hypothetical protein
MKENTVRESEKREIRETHARKSSCKKNKMVTVKLAWDAR